MWLELGITLGISGVIWFIASRKNLPPGDALSRLGEKLGGGEDFRKGVAWGNALGAPVTIRFTERWGPAKKGQERRPWTEFDVSLPVHYPLELSICRDLRHLVPGAQGDVIDIELGDARFDRTYIVEAAPAEVARILLDAEARTFLSGFYSFDLETHPAEKPFLRFAVPGWLAELSEALPVAEQLVRLVGGLRDAYAGVDQGAPVLGGSPFRLELVAQPTDEAAAAARDSEVLAHRHRRRERSRFLQLSNLPTIVLHLAIAAFVAWNFWMFW